MSDERKTKVCFAATHVYPLFNRASPPVHGGAEVQIHFLARHLAANPRFEVSLIAGDFGQPAVETIDGIRIFKSFDPHRRAGLADARAYYRLLQRVGADVYLSTTASNTVFVMALFCALHRKQHIHRVAHEREVDRRLPMKGVVAPLFRLALRRAAVVLVQNERHGRMLRDNLGVDSVVLRNAFPIPDRLPPTGQKRHVLWVARCVPWKRPEMFLRVAERLPDAAFVMVAPPSGRGEGYQREIAGRAAHLRNVRFLDHVPFDQIQALFDEALIFVNTSEREGFPNSFVQAGMGGAPVVSLDVNPDEFISRHDCGMFCAGSFDALCRGLGELLADEAMRTRQGANCFRYVREHHDINIVSEQLKALIGTVAG